MCGLRFRKPSAWKPSNGLNDVSKPQTGLGAGDNVTLTTSLRLMLIETAIDCDFISYAYNLSPCLSHLCASVTKQYKGVFIL